MHLTTEESRRLSADDGTLKVWRFKSVVRECEEGKSYTSGGIAYTVISKRALTREQVRSEYPQSLRRKIWAWWQLSKNRQYVEVWEVVLGLGDFSDTVRYMAPTGSGSDYTSSKARAMKDEGPALSAKELAGLDVLRA